MVVLEALWRYEEEEVKTQHQHRDVPTLRRLVNKSQIQRAAQRCDVLMSRRSNVVTLRRRNISVIPASKL